MSSLFFSSGTSGKVPKQIIYSPEDHKVMRKAIKHVYEVMPVNNGVVFQMLPAFPNLGFHFAKLYEEVAPIPVLHTAGVLGLKKILQLAELAKPVCLVGLIADVKKVEQMMSEQTKENLHTICVANGCALKDREYFMNKGYNFHMTYGFSEAKMAWVSDKEHQGYQVFKDCGRTFKVIDNELVMFSPDYPDGHRTGDLGEIIYEDDERQVIDIDIARIDGKVKYAVCKLGLKK